MRLYTLDPILDSRWDVLVASHPDASVFHQKGWLQALRATYGYRPLVVTTSPDGEPLSNGIVFCEVKSWITGNRLVSLPFSDHCEPLLDQNGGLGEFVNWMTTACREHNWEYIELRPLFCAMSPQYRIVKSQSFWFHTLDLTSSLSNIFNDLHRNCVQRRIRRAERAQLSYVRGCSEQLLNDFYQLLMITRKRHQLLPQPRGWFENVMTCMKPQVDIRLARKDGVAVAGILTLRNRQTVVYKYGCSDAQFNHLGGMPFLMWKMIEESKLAGAERIDFGRTDLDNDGLRKFKNRFGATCRRLTYLRYPENARRGNVVDPYLPAARHLFSVLPSAITSLAGRIAYRHIG